jgi:hypothetical protein
MDTLLYVGQIIVGATLLGAALALSSRRRALAGTSDTSVTSYVDVEVTGANCLFGALFAVAAIAFGVAGVAGVSVLPAPAGVLVTGVGLISVLLGMETTPESYRVAVDAVSVVPVPRASTEVLTIPSRVRTDPARPSSRHAA